MPLALTCPEGPSDTGAYRLSWTGPKDAEFVVEETGPEGTERVYEGPNLATTVSGRVEGTYAYRVGAGEAWSSTCEVLVDPPALSTALTFFGFGLFVVAATVLLVVRGHRAHRRGEI